MGDEKKGRTFGDTVARIVAKVRTILLVVGILVGVGLVAALRLQLDLIATLFSGIFAVTLTLYVFVRLWPPPKGEEEAARQAEEAKALVARVEAETRPGPLRVQRGQVKLSQRATQVLAMTIKGMIGREREKRN
ncbi:MAG: hypothetical protein A3F84_12155 [Candidatus Handelsmanbacteria bacterium RIFCSPLOWO2_12_FULL_64_10]|uniref:Uncharacterized protein n=1 Tax=Handelsmanbacteria sp. (strain RIFCSPLOWO2_12_FULL_64_10) TaxID=1817868 RepID=A0A1F6C999_HANXR|nr:MAG: hypothetical protein A3F84_12155 [Candidatus Handelsmanbacteria bacterium RIFCSPLOWO2_12_FULL_64_10]